MSLPDFAREHETLYITDAELIRRMGVPEKIGVRTTKLNRASEGEMCNPGNLVLYLYLYLGSVALAYLAGWHHFRPTWRND